MRADTKKKHEMGRRSAILIGVAAAGVMALGAQTASSTTGESVDSTPPDLQLSGPKKQSPQNVPRDCPPSASSRCDPCNYYRHACDLEVQVSCDEVCTLRATGKLTNVKMDKLGPVGPYDMCPAGETIDEELALCPEFGPALRPGPDGTHDVRPGLAKYAQRKQVRKALDKGENVQAKVTLKATDAAGNVATAKRTITLVK